MDDWEENADIERVRVNRNEDGSIPDHDGATPISVTVSVDKNREIDGAERASSEGEVRARLNYRYDDGLAWVDQFTDVSTPRCESGWTGFDFVKVLPLADTAVAGVSGVEAIRLCGQILSDYLDEGDRIDVRMRSSPDYTREGSDVVDR